MFKYINNVYFFLEKLEIIIIDKNIAVLTLLVGGLGPNVYLYHQYIHRFTVDVTTLESKGVI